MDVLLAERRIYNRKEFVEAIEKKRTTLTSIENQREGMKLQIKQANENLDQSAKDIKNLTKFIAEDEKIKEEFFAKYKEQCKNDIDALAEKAFLFTHITKFNKDWIRTDDAWKEFEWKRTEILQKIHVDKDLIEKYPDFMIKDMVWGKTYDPMKEKEGETQ